MSRQISRESALGRGSSNSRFGIAFATVGAYIMGSMSRLAENEWSFKCQVEGDVSKVHIGVTDKTAKCCNPSDTFDVVVRNSMQRTQRSCRANPTFPLSDQVRVDCGQTHNASATNSPHSVKPFGLQKDLPISGEQVCVGRCDPAILNVEIARRSLTSRSNQRCEIGSAPAGENFTSTCLDIPSLVRRHVNLGCSPPADDPAMSPSIAALASDM